MNSRHRPETPYAVQSLILSALLAGLGLIAATLPLTKAGMWWWIGWYGLFLAWLIAQTVVMRRMAAAMRRRNADTWGYAYNRYLQTETEGSYVDPESRER